VEYLRGGILELRARSGHVQYRILFFYQDRDVVVLAHSFVKKGSRVPESDIDIAISRKRRFETDRKRHTYEQEKNY
jgi:phage-related protein